MLKIETVTLKRVGEVEVEINAGYHILELKVIGSNKFMIVLIDTELPKIKRRFLLINNVWIVDYGIETLKYLCACDGFYLFEFID